MHFCAVKNRGGGEKREQDGKGALSKLRREGGILPPLFSSFPLLPLFAS